MEEKDAEAIGTIVGYVVADWCGLIASQKSKGLVSYWVGGSMLSIGAFGLGALVWWPEERTLGKGALIVGMLLGSTFFLKNQDFKPIGTLAKKWWNYTPTNTGSYGWLSRFWEKNECLFKISNYWQSTPLYYWGLILCCAIPHQKSLSWLVHPR